MLISWSVVNLFVDIDASFHCWYPVDFRFAASSSLFCQIHVFWTGVWQLLKVVYDIIWRGRDQVLTLQYMAIGTLLCHFILIFGDACLLPGNMKPKARGYRPVREIDRKEIETREERIKLGSIELTEVEGFEKEHTQKFQKATMKRTDRKRFPTCAIQAALGKNCLHITFLILGQALLSFISCKMEGIPKLEWGNSTKCLGRLCLFNIDVASRAGVVFFSHDTSHN